MAADPNHHRKQPVERNEEQPFQIERDDRIDWERKLKRRRERPDYDDELDDSSLDALSNGDHKPKKSKTKKRRRVRNNSRMKRKALLDAFYDEDTDYYT